MEIGSLVKRKPKWGDWVKHNPWMTDEKDLEIGIILSVGLRYYEVLWSGQYIKKHDEIELDEVK